MTAKRRTTRSILISAILALGAAGSILASSAAPAVAAGCRYLIVRGGTGPVKRTRLTPH